MAGEFRKDQASSIHKCTSTSTFPLITYTLNLPGSLFVLLAERDGLCSSSGDNDWRCKVRWAALLWPGGVETGRLWGLVWVSLCEVKKLRKTKKRVNMSVKCKDGWKTKKCEVWKVSERMSESKVKIFIADAATELKWNVDLIWTLCCNQASR